MNDREKQIIGLIHREVKPALGCTEPIAVALAVSKSAEILQADCGLDRLNDDIRIRVAVSGNILKNGMGADEFADNIRELLSVVGEEDEIIMFADIVGGSPLSTAANVIAEEGLLDKTLMIGGMNLPLVLTGVLSKDDMTFDEIKTELLEDAAAGLKVFSVETEAGADDDI